MEKEASYVESHARRDTKDTTRSGDGDVLARHDHARCGRGRIGGACGVGRLGRAQQDGVGRRVPLPGRDLPYEYPALFSMPLAFLLICLFSVTDRSARAVRERSAFHAQFVQSEIGTAKAAECPILA